MSKDIKWAGLCGDDSLFWDSQLTLNTSNPDLTSCFQATILVWVPSAILWLCAVFYLPFLCHKPSVNGWRHKSVINWIKLVDVTLLLVVSLANIIRAITLHTDGQPSPVSNWVAWVVLIVSYGLVAVLTHLEYKKGRHTSGPLFAFWVFMVLCGIIPFRSYIDGDLKEADTFSCVTFYISYALALIQFALLFIADVKALDRQEKFLSEEEKPLLGNDLAVNRQESVSSKPPCPEARISFFSSITHMWITKTIIRGYKKPIIYDDLTDFLPKDKCKSIEPLFRNEWNRRLAIWKRKHPQSEEDPEPDSEKSVEQSEQSDAPTLNAKESKEPDGSDKGEQEKPLRKGPSLILTLFKTSAGPIAISFFCRLFVTFCDFLNPILLQLVIGYIGGGDEHVWKGYFLAVVVLLTNLINPLFFHMFFKYAYITGMRTRSAVITAVYRKALRLSNASRRTTTVGEIVNLMSIDAQKLHDICNNMHEIWACPMLIVIAIALLWNVIGPSCLAAVGVLLIFSFLNGAVFGRLYMKAQAKQMKHKDSRIKLINEILSGIKVLKMYAWEPSFSEAVHKVREEELGCVKKQAYYSGGINLSWVCAPYLVSLATFTTYVLSSPDNYLTPQIAFVSLNLIQLLNFGMSFLPLVIAFGAQAYVSMKRVTNMLMQDELDPDATGCDPSQDAAIVIQNGTFSWGAKSDHPVLRDINLTIDYGKLVAVVGQVGYGKSSLISAMLGELKKLDGTVNVQGSVAYVPQQAWIQNATLKNNILFGKPFDQTRYDKVVEACALTHDLKILPSGDKTEIGEKGINLSGGQKQRVSLARAVYQNCDIYLLDDPLSAVDSHVGKHIFDNLVGPSGMLRNKTRVLVTHGVTYLPKVDEIVVLTKGRVSETGKFDTLLQNQGAFAEFIKTYLNENGESDEDSDEDQKVRAEIQKQLSVLSDGQESVGTPDSKLRRRLSKRVSTRSHGEVESVADGKPDIKKKNILIEEEVAEVGKIKWGVLWNYIKAGGLRAFSILVIFTILNVVSQVATNIWLSKWSDDPIYEDASKARDQVNLRLGVYGGLGGFQVVAVLGSTLATFLGAVIATRVLHKRLLNSIMRAPMSFFDTTPLGRILNRFSTDIDKLDSTIPSNTMFWSFQVVSMVSTLILISYSTPIFLSVVLPLGLLYYIIQRVYITTVRQLKRIDSIRRSPIYVNFDETLVGVTCVRAFKEQERFIAKNDRLVDESQLVWYPILIAQRWLGFYLDCLGAVIVFFATLFAVIQRDSITGGLAGLSVTFSIQATFGINMMVRGATELETHVVSVERVQEYSETAPEAPWEVEGNKPDSSWPDEGTVEFGDYSTRYRPGLELVLHGLSFKVSPGEKVGIVGRTGAGKSSMALSLFRIIEAAGGQITIDGVNISNIGLHDLRGRLTIIPQDPVVFSGTLRTNLDPFLTHTDDEVWAALEHAHLKTFVAELPSGLEHDCGEGGEALSVGQRQLVCLARALLRKSKILVLDEATAAVDMETDDLIQNTIRTEFKGCTVLTVAHRLNTILDYDRVMVLDKGEIKEFGAPNELLGKADSAFYSMAKDAGVV